jgi:hypothetical protein
MLLDDSFKSPRSWAGTGVENKWTKKCVSARERPETPDSAGGAWKKKGFSFNRARKGVCGG